MTDWRHLDLCLAARVSLQPDVSVQLPGGEKSLVGMIRLASRENLTTRTIQNILTAMILSAEKNIGRDISKL